MALRAAGFIDVAGDDVTGAGDDGSAILRSAYEGFLRLLAERAPDEAAHWRDVDDELAAIAAIVRGPDYRRLQFFARRPSI